MVTLDTKDRERLRSNDQTGFESRAAKERARRRILSAAERHGIDVDAESNVAQLTRRGRLKVR